MRDDSKQAAALELFKLSPLKQAKYAAISELLPASCGSHALDLGADNGVIALLLRQHGGKWSSGDMNPDAVAMIGELVGKEDAHLISDSKLPFPDNSFDLVVVVDMLEHVSNDSQLIAEIARVVTQDGTVIVHVPNPKINGIIRKLRYAIGQTDAAHGHLRPGYTLKEISQLFAPQGFIVSGSVCYSRCFSQLADLIINFGVSLLKGKKHGNKGVIVSAGVVSSSKKMLRVYKLAYPFVKLLCMLDILVPRSHPEMLVVRLSRGQQVG